MKKVYLFAILFVTTFQHTVLSMSNETDSVYLFSYATDKNANKDGLHFAWSDDRKQWIPIGPEHSYLKCDYGTWGAEKNMFDPYLFQDNDGLWHCIWSVNDYDSVFAHAAADDLILWRRQSYPEAVPGKNCLMPEVVFNSTKQNYTITWLSVNDGDSLYYRASTEDFRKYTPAIGISSEDRLNMRTKVSVSGVLEEGTIHKVPKKFVDGLLRAHELTVSRNQLWSETTKDYPELFASLESVDATITVNGSESKPISDMLIGIFFEDINYAADGGLYGELIQNRGFEYSLSDKMGKDKSWNYFKAWQISGVGTVYSMDSVSPIHFNNKHYVVLNTSKAGGALVNEGFDGIPLKKGEKYNISLFARMVKGRNGNVRVRIVGSNDEVYGEVSIKKISGEWQKYSAVLTANTTVPNAKLEVIPQTTGCLALDMVSLFPQETFKGRKNGLRADLAQVIADIKPQFVRFPGGCVAHGDGIENIYHWKNTIGPLEARKPQRNIWNYHQSAGLGYFEYFQFCEDINAEPIPIVAAGVPCQNSSCGGAGQQGGIPMCKMQDYVQDVLDLIEWANGSTDTYWGKKRAEAGHPNSFNLKYIGVGNEDLITDIFEERFTMIYEALKEKYPEITVIGTVGPWFEGTDYREGWELANKLNIPMVDEHYYQSPGWFIYNQDFYDQYDRSKSKVYLGEYAAHLPGRPNNLETALAEASYLTALERNGDVVQMASYAPLLAKEGYTQWNPDLIYFNNTEVKPTVGYYVQKLYGLNSGNSYISNKVELSDDKVAVKKRVAVSVVRDSETNDLILKLVNMLAVDVNTTVNLDKVGAYSPLAVRTVLTGMPDEKMARPEIDSIEVSDHFLLTLPAMSFTVLRIKSK